MLLVSDASRFVFCFGTTDIGGIDIDTMLIRWSDQEDYTNWAPAATNQAGSISLSMGSEIVTAIQARQEILVWTDAALYSLQYVGAPVVWGSQLVGTNTSIVSQKVSLTLTALRSGWVKISSTCTMDGCKHCLALYVATCSTT